MRSQTTKSGLDKTIKQAYLVMQKSIEELNEMAEKPSTSNQSKTEVANTNSQNLK